MILSNRLLDTDIRELIFEKKVKVLKDIDVGGRAVFLRADLDVPFEPTNDERLTTNADSEEAIRLQNLKPTVDYLIERGAKQIIIAGHIGRPSPRLRNGKPVIDPAFSTKQLLPILEKILGQKISYIDVILGSEATPESEKADSGQALRLRSGQLKDSELNRTARMTGEPKIVLLENLRFWGGETKNDAEFAKKLAALADVYVNEAFGNCHRAHASMVALPLLFSDVEDPDGVHSRRAAGLRLEKEIEELSQLLKNPQRPFVAIVGGAKIETKVPVVENLAKVADWVLVGGEIAKEIANGRQLTADSSKRLAVGGERVVVAILTKDGNDIDGESTDKFKSIIANAKTVVWNGPMGVFEEGFEKGSLAIAQAIIESGAHSVVGGGETTQFLARHGLLSKFSFVSSGGGAMLMFLAGKELAGIKVLE